MPVFGMPSTESKNSFFSAKNIPTSYGDAIITSFERGLDETFSRSAERIYEMYEDDLGFADSGRMLSPNEANSLYYVEGFEPFREPVSEHDAKLRYDRNLIEKRQRRIIEQSPEGLGRFAIDLGTTVAATLFDPLEMALFSIPVAGEVKGASILSRMGSRAGIGAIDATVGMSLVEPMRYTASKAYGSDYGLDDLVMNVMASALFGASAHALGGAMGDMFHKLPLTTQKDVARVMIKDAMDGDKFKSHNDVLSVDEHVIATDLASGETPEQISGKMKDFMNDEKTSKSVSEFMEKQEARVGGDINITNTQKGILNKIKDKRLTEMDAAKEAAKQDVTTKGIDDKAFIENEDDLLKAYEQDVKSLEETYVSPEKTKVTGEDLGEISKIKETLTKNEYIGKGLKSFITCVFSSSGAK